MACALFVIIVVQYFWVETLYNQSRNHFNRDIRIALNTTSSMIFSENFSNNSDLIDEFKRQSTMDYLEPEYYLNEPTNDINDLKFPFNGNNIESIDFIDRQKALNRQHKKEFMKQLSKAYDGIMALRNFTTEAEIDPQQIDSLIQVALDLREIDAKYEFAITDDQNQFIYRSNEEINKVVYLNSGYKERFFLEGLKSPHHIHLVIKKKFAYIVNTIRPIIIILTIMILIIAGSFYYALRIIFNQKKLSEIKTDFINNMTHELKTPISTISLALEALLQFGLSADESRTKKYLEICKSENKRLGKMVENVLNAAAYQKGDLKLKLEELDLHTMIYEVVESIEVQVKKNNGYIIKNLCSTQTKIQVDQVHFTNIFFNLLDNANKYFRERPEIEIKTENDSSHIYIEIKDNGIGMKKEDQSRIFDRFYRVPTGNVHNVKGYGLGLSYVYDVVKKHGGEIKVVSEYGKGTTFKIKLPYGREN